LSEESVRLGMYWVLGGIPMAFGAFSAFFNIHRHWAMHQIRKTGRTQNISGTPFVSSFFFLLGWWITPLPFSPWIFLILLVEGPALVTIVPEEEPE